jgi:DNA-binding NarL/FixJ family response regulator
MKKFIIADDHSFIRMGLIQLLKDAFPNAAIKEVPDGESLIKEIMQEDFDLVISDLDMPGRNGLEVLEQIKLIKPSLPVLILSIYAEELYAARALKSGASGYLNKNTAPYELIKAIERISLGRKYITPELAEHILSQLHTDKQPHELLSNREFEIFKQLATGKSVSQIAEMLNLALSTVSTHRSRILEKLTVNNNAELTRYAMAHKIISDLRDKEKE